jgi:hypothetical protein
VFKEGAVGVSHRLADNLSRLKNTLPIAREIQGTAKPWMVFPMTFGASVGAGNFTS